MFSSILKESPDAVYISGFTGYVLGKRLSTYIYFNKRIGKIIVKFYLILLFLFIIIMIYVESNQERAQFYSENRFIYLLQNYWFHYLLFGLVLFLVITNMEAIIKKIQSWIKK